MVYIHIAMKIIYKRVEGNRKTQFYSTLMRSYVQFYAQFWNHPDIDKSG